MVAYSQTSHPSKIRRDNRLVPLKGWPVYANAPRLERFSEVVELDIGFFYRLEWAWTRHASHVAVFRNFCFRRGLGGRNTGVVRASDDHMFERIKIIPGADKSGSGHNGCRWVTKSRARIVTQICPR